ncbi:MAG: PepSY-like domain-containing protein [Muribaculaceae bacterium]|nr:PepSY-like domain-containing protein [Muribaculaceae bacterium]MDE6842441.1 PepSY-like domain-containing protein [Muribaculaceae bacterium]
MKKFLKFLPVLLAGILAISLWSCDDDKDEPVAYDELPAAAQTFLTTYYPSVKTVSVTKDKDEFDVVLANGHKVDFNKQGEWQDVDAPMGQTIPTGFYPSAIDDYVANMANNAGINEISKIREGYEVETLTGLEIHFSSEGNFIGYDN